MVALRRENVQKPVVFIGTGTCGLGAGAAFTLEKIRQYLEKNAIDADIVEVGCIGLCVEEPLVDVQLPGRCRLMGKTITQDKVDEFLKAVFAGETPKGLTLAQFKTDGLEPWDGVKFQDEHPFFGPQTRWVLRNCGVINPASLEEYLARDGYRGLKKVLSTMSGEAVCKEIEQSGLRGRGGGGFPTGMKWKFAFAQKDPQKYLVCNADEGDPGAFMDRAVIEGDPHRLLEGMAIAAYAIGADKGYIYIRAEYPLAIERLKHAIAEAEANNLLGEKILGTDFSLKMIIKMGAGAFVCGEETALIHSMEGERGEPTVKPPFPAESGYLGKPTNVNNVETYANVPVIFLKGPEWFSSIGTEKSKGTKVFALAGKINNVGLIEVPMGITLREIIYEIGGGIKGGKKFKAMQTGGPSGGCLVEKHLDTPIDYENLSAAGSMMGSGGMIVLDEDDCMVSVAKYYLEFTVEESCGKCVPCRVGNKRLHETLEKICEGKGTEEDLPYLKNLSNVIKDTSLCGLGQTSPNPVLSTMEYFWDEYVAHVTTRTCPSGKCKALMTYTIDPAKCTGCTLCARNCPVDAIAGEKREPHVIDQTKCIRCGACYDKCKFSAINVQ
ncbi:MAG TPA: NADH-quinone oxidoreductase subunit J/K [Planctomycetaceae bacterium]|nr:NADH-quinone oxidoreductase subunit J/K [Planctomycetaceae bacterium]